MSWKSIRPFHNSPLKALSRILGNNASNSSCVRDCSSRSDAVCMSLRAYFAKQSPLETGDCFVAANAPRNDIIITTLPSTPCPAGTATTRPILLAFGTVISPPCGAPAAMPAALGRYRDTSRCAAVRCGFSFFAPFQEIFTRNHFWLLRLDNSQFLAFFHGRINNQWFQYFD